MSADAERIPDIETAAAVASEFRRIVVTHGFDDPAAAALDAYRQATRDLDIARAARSTGLWVDLEDAAERCASAWEAARRAGADAADLGRR